MLEPDALRGKTVLVDVTCISPAGKEIDQFQVVGVIELASERSIGIRRKGMTELYGLPPLFHRFRAADPDETYIWRRTGEALEPVDFVVDFSVSVGDAEMMLMVRSLGFQNA
ncbi:unannotated protein [freshwater metagenome]|uniref:Unannotated protein n=1 Tax=freshwater metagenome TaxID=449393 RepID=A0A6J6Q663_9ZZZZ